MASSTEPPKPLAVSEEWPPTPKAVNRRNRAGEYVKVSVTVDKSLWALFEAERDRLEVSSSGKLLDRILWLYFDKPPLSYQSDQADREEE